VLQSAEQVVEGTIVHGPALVFAKEADELESLLFAFMDLGLEVAVLRTEFEDFKKQAGFKPKSTRPMTEDDARQVVLGDLRTKGIKEAAILVGLSYGQVYSARNGYTFKEVYEEKVRRKRVEEDKRAVDAIETLDNPYL